MQKKITATYIGHSNADYTNDQVYTLLLYGNKVAKEDGSGSTDYVTQTYLEVNWLIQ